LSGKGIEDARFTKFIGDDGSITYYATYTAYDGQIIIPKLLKTKDFTTSQLDRCLAPVLRIKIWHYFHGK
jgi:predicted GH43/DUF377 family glycosyl hydrolase